ncbi:VanW family protein [Chryseobacterium gambrini]|uniref:VanW family protein n=1 Tax=Chryseobacterium gambrini TaxID=373672 RepID=A0AAJ1R2S6_9FLAO|nr:MULTISPECIES: VanW family protein [Chryseobacterium]MDN4011980.1 VanW family protein [Chryseobacterium gambrini]MDN4029305.1 VanW family protein [Chryseobacterium gambrini]QWA40536.1 VanW family protein [Chryseobacterium sp. ZHDP1]
MRQQLRKLLPNNFKLQLKLLRRYINESKTQYSYPKYYSSENIGEYKTELRQIIRKGEFYENKLHNLKIVGEKINHLIIYPNEVFSFWKLIGKPNEKNNFKEGRNLIKNNISSDFGGGICQFSSILYFLALQSGLKIIERFPHSIDIYKDHERFTPLGSDCTVVYGYKDLQFQNTFSFPVQLQCFVNDEELSVCFLSPKEIVLNTINFSYSEIENGVWVETLQDGKVLLKNFYIRL